MSYFESNYAGFESNYAGFESNYANGELKFIPLLRFYFFKFGYSNIAG